MSGRRRNGIALVAALALMTLIGLLVVGGVAASTIAQRETQLAQSDARAASAVDYAMNTVLAEPNRFPLSTLVVGDRRTYVVPIDGDAQIAASVSATALGGGAFWLVADAASTGIAQAHRRINVVASYPWVGPLPAAAVIARGAIRVGPRTLFAASDAASESCAPSAAFDVIQSPGSSFTGDGPRVGSLAIAGDSTTFLLRTAQRAALGGAPATVRVTGDTTIAGGTFDGILIADGTITIAGPLAVSGLMVARDRIVATAGELTVTGAMMAFGASAGTTPVIDIDRATIRYSPCTVQKFLRSAVLLRPARRRAWVELF